MTRNELGDAYFNWMYRTVCSTERRTRRASYRKLLRHLHTIDFNYTIPMDGNRAEDGINLRYDFRGEHDYEYALIASYLDDRPCSVLEMMVALAIRCEEHIMGDSDVGDRTSLWFWTMIDNLGLGAMNDTNFNREYVDERINIFLDREYERNGEGGLFTVYNHDCDLRNVQIWYQMCWYLTEIM